MESPLLSPTAETSGTSETYQTMLPSPPPPDVINESLERMPIDREQQYWKNPSIYRVPASITNLNRGAYQPKVVSFGPYHHGEIHLRPMEEHKRRVLRHFLKRSGKSLKHFHESLREVAHKLEDSYDALDPKWKEGTGDQFLELMITDGYFMLEIMRAAAGAAAGEKLDYAVNDPIFSMDRLTYIAPYIYRDMLLLENQLPMLVLYQLVTAENNGKEVGDEYINKLILDFCIPDSGITRLGRCLHVIDVVRKGLQMEPRKVLKDGEEIIRSATELNEAGIRFKKSKTNSLTDISFNKCTGVLRLPVITVEDTTESTFLNTMTFERLHIRDGNEFGNEVTSYVIFMDNIINNEQDVALLHDKGIIQTRIGSDKAVANLFNSLCKEVTLPSNNSLNTVQRDISAYCEKHWNKWRANLNHNYFTNPWTILSLIAAVFLFALTIIQTVYAVLTYY